MFHLVVTRQLPRHKVGSLITDAAEIEKILAGPEERGVVKVFDHLTHVGVAAAAAAANAAAAKASVPAAEPAKA